MSNVNENSSISQEIATLGGGCFWCLDPIYAELVGVEKVEVGYSGGKVKNPTYQQVSSKTTGHAEVVQVTFDPDVISYEEILKIFFTFHDPTTLNRQGADVGPQYRSVIFYHDDVQREAAESVIEEIEAQGIWSDPIITEITPFEEFFIAEEYHQDYFIRNPEQGYCRVVIAPKVVKFRKSYAEQLKKTTN
jgi:peptide-methionine (S)-S-oxide reductase